MFVILGKPVANVLRHAVQNRARSWFMGIQSALSNNRNTTRGLFNCVAQELQAPLVTSQANQPSHTNSIHRAQSLLSNYPLDTHEKFRFLRLIINTVSSCRILPVMQDMLKSNNCGSRFQLHCYQQVSPCNKETSILILRTIN
jgi:hypothetical protein